MHSYSEPARTGGITSWPRRAEAWLDQRGKGAWIAILVLSFIFIWPVGLALLAYLIWGKRMFSSSCGHRRTQNNSRNNSWDRHAYRANPVTGNHAFDTYKTEALRRLEDEQEAFESFLQRLRNSKDKTEFDAFMEDRARATAAQDMTVEDTATRDATETPAGSNPSAGSRPGEY